MKSTIRLEYFTREDFPQLIDWVNNEKLMQNWTGSLFSYPLTPEKLEWYIEGVNDMEHSDALVYKAVDTETGEAIGHISLGSISRKNQSARISRVLVGCSQARGKGYCRQMIQAILRIGFEELHLHRITLGVYDFNQSAIRCYEKCGFVIEGTFRDVLKYNDKEYWSMVEMGILEDEWKMIHYRKAA